MGVFYLKSPLSYPTSYNTNYMSVTAITDAGGFIGNSYANINIYGIARNGVSTLTTTRIMTLGSTEDANAGGFVGTSQYSTTANGVDIQSSKNGEAELSSSGSSSGGGSGITPVSLNVSAQSEEVLPVIYGIHSSGGFVGFAASNLYLSSNANSLDVFGDFNAGGIAGTISTRAGCYYEITNCQNKSTIDASCYEYKGIEDDYSNYSHAGGILGIFTEVDPTAGVNFAKFLIENSINFGYIYGDYAGGVLGAYDTEQNDHTNKILDSCKNTAKVTGYFYAGGIVGLIDGNFPVRFTNHYNVYDSLIMSGCINYYAAISKVVTVYKLDGTYTELNVSAGGLVGRINAGTITSCRWYRHTNAANMNYVTSYYGYRISSNRIEADVSVTSTSSNSGYTGSGVIPL